MRQISLLRGNSIKIHSLIWSKILTTLRNLLVFINRVLYENWKSFQVQPTEMLFLKKASQTVFPKIIFTEFSIRRYGVRDNEEMSLCPVTSFVSRMYRISTMLLRRGQSWRNKPSSKFVLSIVPHSRRLRGVETVLTNSGTSSCEALFISNSTHSTSLRSPYAI